MCPWGLHFFSIQIFSPHDSNDEGLHVASRILHELAVDSCGVNKIRDRELLGMVYHSQLDTKGCDFACGFPLVPVRSSKGLPAAANDISRDIIDETLYAFRANILFRNFEVSFQHLSAMNRAAVRTWIPWLPVTPVCAGTGEGCC